MKTDDGETEVLQTCVRLEVAFLTLGVVVRRTVNVNNRVLVGIDEIGACPSCFNQFLAVGGEPVAARDYKLEPLPLKPGACEAPEASRMVLASLRAR